MSTKLDYKELGMKAGLEVHQQLATKKLFCNCESCLTEDKGDFTVKRKLRPVASEKGEFDNAALQEHEKGLEYIYEGFNNRICLVELDEEPPHSINQEALKITLEIAKIAHMNIFDNAFVMRKIVVNGSNTSGFQRTATIAKDGYLDIDGTKIRVDALFLEEDASKIIEKKQHEVYYKLDRVGIPLIEFTTKADIHNPEIAKKTALKIGEMFRITGKAMRGLGTIRQDLNISIAKGARVEIKGLQYVNLIDLYAENEVLRQVKLLEVKDLLNKKTSKKELKFEIFDITNEMEKCENKKVLEGIKKGQKALAICLKNFNGILGYEIGPNKRVGSELSGFAKAKANVLGLFHSDELPKYDIDKNVVESISKKLKLEKEDAFILIVEKENIAKKALKAVFDRTLVLFDGISEETREPNKDGTSTYMRPLPGAARMYPETDVPIISIDKNLLEDIKNNLPRWYNERVEQYTKTGLHKQVAEYIAKSNYARDFGKLIGKYNIKTLATMFSESLKNEDIKEEIYLKILDAEKNKKIDKKEFKDIIKKYKKEKDIDSILNNFEKSEMDNETKKIIQEILNDRKDFIKSKGLIAHKPVMGAVIGTVMKTGKKPDMKLLSEYVLEEIKEML
jgi:glutamyl-tRNA(Gln) amidotransferase subunit E